MRRFVGLTGMVASKHLCGDLDLSILGDHVRRDLHPLDDLDASGSDRIMLHVTHGDEPVNLRHTEPVQDVWHENLESRVRHARHLLCAVEILRGPVAAFLALAHVVDEVLCHLSQGAALLPEVNANSCSSPLGTLDALLDGVRQVRPASADVGAEHVAAIALIVHAAGELHGLVGDLLGVAPDVYCHATNERQEQLEVPPRQQLRIHGVGLLEDRLPQFVLRDAEALREARQVPHRLDGGLGHEALAVLGEHGGVGAQAAGLERLPALGQLDVRLRHGDRRADVVALLQPRREALGDNVPEGVDGHDLLRPVPGGEGPDAGHGGSHAQPRQVAVVKVLPDPCKGPVDGVAAGVRPDGVALVWMSAGCEDGSAQLWCGCAPIHDHGHWAIGAVVRRQRSGGIVDGLNLGDGGGVAVGGVLSQDPGDGLVV
mmetsp:Transcript_51127/g.122994  ORF Transcript_51127/g.122994 Transcript_51127/m.122994 type:complete len:429 (-) Transcript_51127:1632-2918(-)